MPAYKTMIFSTFLCATFATTGFAQESTTTPLAADTAAPALDCDAQFTALDTDADGYLSDVEAPREYARSRIDEVTLQDTGINAEEFASQCATDHWAQYTPEDGAPFDGANSFTADQARDRAVAWNVTDVSALELDDQGIWRGMGKMNGADVEVAVDYKGNVVTSPRS